MNLKEIIRRISYYRNSRGMSARDLSMQIGMHQTYISKLESQNFNIPVGVLLEIISALGVEVEEFFSENFMSYRPDKELYSSFCRLSAENKEIILNLVKKLK